EETGFPGGKPHARRRSEPFVIADRRRRRRVDAPSVLRSLQAETARREQLIGFAEPRAVLAGVVLQRPILVLADATHVQLQRLPGPEPVGELVGKRPRAAGDTKGFLRDEAGSLVVAMAVALVALKPRDDHNRPLGADDADDVAQDIFAAPLAQRLLEPLR